MKKSILMVLLLFLLVSSCQKKKENWSVTIEGKITDYYTEAHLFDVGLIIEECRTPLVTSTHCGILDTIYSDQFGLYHYVLSGFDSGRLFDESTFQISVVPSTFYANSEVREIDIEKNNSFDFRIKPL